MLVISMKDTLRTRLSTAHSRSMYSTLMTLPISASRTVASRTRRNSCRLVPALPVVQLLTANSRTHDINAVINAVMGLRQMIVLPSLLCRSTLCSNSITSTCCGLVAGFPFVVQLVVGYDKSTTTNRRHRVSAAKAQLSVSGQRVVNKGRRSVW